MIDEKCDTNLTPAMACLLNNKFETLRLLNYFKADFFLKNDEGLTVYDLMAKLDNEVLFSEYFDQWVV